MVDIMIKYRGFIDNKQDGLKKYELGHGKIISEIIFTGDTHYLVNDIKNGVVIVCPINIIKIIE